MAMLAKLVIILSGLLSNPKQAIDAAILYEDAPAYKKEIYSIARRESRFQPVGVHAIDSWASRKAWSRAMKKGWLHSWCPFHMYSSGWASRGMFGMFAAYNLRYLGIDCAPAALLDVPFVSTIIVIRKMRYVCAAYGACDEHDRHLVWSGLVKYYAQRGK